MPSNDQLAVVAIGAACLDIKGRLEDDALAETSNPGYVRITAGGCARNIAENLARLGVSVGLLSVACEDDFGRAILAQTERAGVNVDHVLISCAHHSAAYMALLNPQGQLLFGVDDTSTVAQLTVEYIDNHADLLRAAQMVIVDANLALETTQAVLAICEQAGVPVGLDPVSYRRAQHYRPLIGRFALVTPNRSEAEALTGMSIRDENHAILVAKQLVSRGVKTAIVTLDERGLVYATRSDSGYVPAIQVDVVDSTGASDALTATVVYGLLHDIPLDEAVRLGVSAAALTLGSTETVRQDLTLENLYAQLLI
jgi:pseudouridine kinase